MGLAAQVKSMDVIYLCLRLKECLEEACKQYHLKII